RRFISDILQRLRPESLGELREIQALWNHRHARRIDRSLRQHRPRSKWPWRKLRLTDASDQPVHRAGWILHDVTFRPAIPDHTPTHRPAVPGSHLATIAQLDRAPGNAHVVVEHSDAPALMRF